MKKLILILLIIFSTGILHSQTDESAAYFIVPPANSGVMGGVTFLGPLSNAQRTYQMLIRDSLLTGMVGHSLTAMTFRLISSAVSNWPASDVTFTNYDIYLSGSVAPENRSMTFSQNVVGVQRRVRAGTLTITAGSFPAGGNPTTFGADITFDSAYTYTGGHLLIEIRHTGFTGTSTSVDALSTSSSGYGYLYSALWVASYTGTSTTTQGNFCVTRITGSPVTSTGTQNELAMKYRLNQNYPNPFNPVTNISFTVPVRSAVTLKIYDVNGKETETLLNNEEVNAGMTSILYNAEKLCSGVYFYTLYINGVDLETRKMLLVK